MQMIRGGGTAVLVMPAAVTTGEAAGCRCGSGKSGCAAATSFSLGSVELKHGLNNLFPVIQPFPDWRAFERPRLRSEKDHRSTRKTAAARSNRSEPARVQSEYYLGPAIGLETDCDSKSSATAPGAAAESSSVDNGPRNRDRRSHQPIINAVDTFLDDRGRLLWVLDTGSENACYRGDVDDDRSSPEADSDQHSPPKVIAIDVHTNQVVNVISLSQVWKPGVSCFQYVVAVYADGPEATDRNGSKPITTGNAEGAPANSSASGSGCAADWPLVVVGDAGTNRVLVYSHGKDRFSEIMLPAEEELDGAEEGEGYEDRGAAGPTSSKGRGWSAPSVRDILYTVPLYGPEPGLSRLLITYHGCRDVYRLRLQTSTADSPTYRSKSGAVVQPVPVTGTLTVIGRKPCRMVILGADRRRTDVQAGGGTTVFFRLENTNDIWSWDTNDRRKSRGVDERDFRLVRVGRTCRVPVAVSAAPATASKGGPAQQLVWMLETNFVDHFAGATDRMGANAKLQPLETSAVQYGEGREATAGPFRVQPASTEGRLRQNCTACSRRPVPRRSKRGTAAPPRRRESAVPRRSVHRKRDGVEFARTTE